jgi:hypothetical protein
LLFARRAFALFLFVQVAAVILDAADRRDSVGRNLNQVQTALTRNAQRLIGRQDAELLPVFVDYPDFASANPVIDANKRLGRTFIECDGAPPRLALRQRCGILPHSGMPDRRTLSIALAR